MNSTLIFGSKQGGGGAVIFVEDERLIYHYIMGLGIFGCGPLDPIRVHFAGVTNIFFKITTQLVSFFTCGSSFLMENCYIVRPNPP